MSSGTDPDPDQPFGPAVAQFDQRFDDLLERLRGTPVADHIFGTASKLGDWSLIWHIVGVLRGLTSQNRARQAVQLSALLGIESLIVNQGIKRLFKRERPTVSGDERYDVRTPSTSSFPSGHASAGFFAATILTGWSGRRLAPLWYGLAIIVAVSRPFVRIHHASDIVAGAFTGAALARVIRRIVSRFIAR